MLVPMILVLVMAPGEALGPGDHTRTLAAGGRRAFL